MNNKYTRYQWLAYRGGQLHPSALAVSESLVLPLAQSEPHLIKVHLKVHLTGKSDLSVDVDQLLPGAGIATKVSN
jgi:hypothetical protein